MKSKTFFFNAFVTFLAFVATNAQDVIFEIDWKHNPNAQTYSLSVSDNLDYIVFKTHELRQPENTNAKVNILNRYGQVIGEYMVSVNDWGTLSKTLVTNSGNIIAHTAMGFVKIKGMWRPQSHILSINKEGKLLWSKRLDDILVGGISITPNGEFISFTGDQNKLFLFDRNGSEIWSHSYGSPGQYLFSDIEISNDGRIIIVRDIQKNQIHAFDSDGKGIWSRDCPQGFRMNKRTKMIGILIPYEDEDISGPTGLLTVALFDHQGQTVKNSVGVVGESWMDLAIADKGEVCSTDKELAGYGLRYYSPARDNESKAAWGHVFEPPSGFQHSNPQVRISGNGETIIFSDGFEIISFKRKQLEKKW